MKAFELTRWQLGILLGLAVGFGMLLGNILVYGSVFNTIDKCLALLG